MRVAVFASIDVRICSKYSVLNSRGYLAASVIATIRVANLSISSLFPVKNGP